MNAILSLSHFCELHGPRVIFNTQAFRDLSSFSPFEDDILNKNQQEKREDNAWKYGELPKEESAKSFPASLSETCAACRSFSHRKPGIISNDDNDQVSYVSSQFPLQNDLFTLLRQACVRSLSCEVCSEREGPIYFGDNSRGHVLSYTFFLKDAQARGFQKWYSILVLMRDKMFLLNSWPFFIKNLEDIIQELQDGAAKVYAIEEEQRKLKQSSVTESLKRQRESSTPRPLTELVDKKKLWQTLHVYFTWIIKAAGMRLEERMVRGPPLTVTQKDCFGMVTPFKFCNFLGRDSFEKLLHHLYIGNRVILKSVDAKLGMAITRTLQALLPPYLFRPCYKVHEYSSTLQPNIFIIANEELSTSDYFSIQNNHGMITLTFNPSEESEHSDLDNFSFTMTESYKLDGRPPQIVPKISTFCSDKNLSLSVMSLFLSTLLEEWTNKVKTWSFLSKTKNVASLRKCPSPQSFLSPRDISRKNYSEPPPPNEFLSRSPSPSISRAALGSNNFSQLLLAVGAQECDVPLLDAWSCYYDQS